MPGRVAKQIRKMMLAILLTHEEMIHKTTTRAILFLVLSVGLVGCGGSKKKYAVETITARKGTITNTVTATGTIQALKTVDVGTQVSGVIKKLYADYNSQVRKGDILAELDKTQLNVAIENAQMSLDDSRAELEYVSSKLERVQALYDKKMLSQSDYDEAKYAYSKAATQLKIAMSNYDKAKINLDYATIYSPIDGVVLSREVDEGQTVAANFNAPTLFSIANDLTQMQVEANIDEADIGTVKKNQGVSFTVDAFADETFLGVVTEIRLNPITTSNVVTYTVIVNAKNPEKKLMPGMTANIEIETKKLSNVLVIPLRATQTNIDSSLVMNYLKSIASPDKPMPQPPVMGKTNGEMNKNTAQVWLKQGDIIRPTLVQMAASDEQNVEIISGIQEGDELLVKITEQNESGSKANPQSRSPFMPGPPKKR